MRKLIKSEFELFIIHAASYMKNYPIWWELGQENMVKHIMRESKGQMNPYVLKDKVIQLFRSAGM